MHALDCLYTIHIRGHIQAVSVQLLGEGMCGVPGVLLRNSTQIRHPLHGQLLPNLQAGHKTSMQTFQAQRTASAAKNQQSKQETHSYLDYRPAEGIV